MFIHGANLTQKERHTTKYVDEESRRYLSEIRNEYSKWKQGNDALKGPYQKHSEIDKDTLQKRVEMLNQYKNFLDQQHYAEHFDSRSNLHSSVLEEFVYYLFRDIVEEYSDNALIGKSRTFKDIFFMPSSYKEMLQSPAATIERKDHDFAIGVHVDTVITTRGGQISEKLSLDIPAVAVECKTYLDKTMLQDASTAAEQLKIRNPNAYYVVVAEWLKLTGDVNLKKFKIDQIYVLRKQKNTDREFRYVEGYKKNPLYADVVIHFFNRVREHLASDWEGGVIYGLERGYLL